MNKTLRLLERIPFFYFLLPIFLLLHIENEYNHLIIYRFVYFEIIQLLIAALLIFLGCLLFFREMTKGSLFAFGFLLLYYYFCDLKDFLQSKHPGFFSSYLFLFPILFLVLLLLFILVRKSKSSFRQLFLYLNILLIILVGWECVSFPFRPGKNESDLGDKQKKFSKEYQSCASCTKPDIYYFVFNGYASSAILKSEFAFDNPMDYLLSLNGFYVTQHSRSNYNLSPYSVGSVLNLDYLPGLKSGPPKSKKDYLSVIATVNQSELFPVLEKEGYKIYNNSIFNIDNIPSSIPSYDYWEINQVYARHNIFWKADQDIGWIIRRFLGIGSRNASQRAHTDARNRHFQQTIESTLSTIGTTINQPKFIYSYFMLPNAPYSFDSVGNGNNAKPQPSNWEESRQSYIDQLKYTNLVIKNLVGTILKNRKRPTVIIVQGDRGFHFEEPSKEQRQFENFNAYYFSNEKYIQIKDSVSNVNTFRFVFNAFFDKKLPLLQDTSFFLQYR